MTISCCIITKNEEDNISDCISSVIDIVDEIILLDTGSTDKTIEIAQSFSKVKVYETLWKNDNSLARNKCISCAKSDWILILDADERLTSKSAKKLKQFIIDNSLTESTIFSFKYLNQNPYSHHKYFFKASFFKNNSNIKYLKPIHDFPYLKDSTNLLCEEFEIIHQNGNTKEFLEKKAKTYINRLIKIISKTNNSGDLSYYYKHLGDAYLTNGDNKLALDSFTRAYHYCSNFDNTNYVDSLAVRIIPLSNDRQLHNFLKRLIKIRPDKYYLDLFNNLEVQL